MANMNYCAGIIFRACALAAPIIPMIALVWCVTFHAIATGRRSTWQNLEWCVQWFTWMGFDRDTRILVRMMANGRTLISR